MIALSPGQTRLVAVASLGRAMRTLATIDFIFVLMYGKLIVCIFTLFEKISNSLTNLVS